MRISPRFRVAAAPIAVALLLTACGSSDDTTDTTTTEDATDATDATDDSSDAADDTADDETADDEMTDDEMTDDAAVDTEAAAGTYAGTWTNTTFGSTGAATATVAFNGDMVSVTIDLDGGVFGEADPEAFTFEGAFTADGASISGTSDLLGAFTFTIDAAGSFAIDAPEVPSERIGAFNAAGVFGGGSLSGTYSVTFPEGGGAEGTFEATKA